MRLPVALPAFSLRRPYRGRAAETGSAKRDASSAVAVNTSPEDRPGTLIPREPGGFSSCSKTRPVRAQRDHG
ncbi:MAG: hypothetical protein JWN04_1351 [Myxococcaceae bacterium]|nr:hypothetical protein [Myxococcaceae bacterium]